MPNDYHGLSAPQWAKVAAYMDAAVDILPGLYRPDCCIAATKIATLVLADRLHMRVRPMTVEVDVVNAALAARDRLPETDAEYRQWQAEDGSYWLTLGARDATARPGHWPGHLVAIVYDRVLLDLTLAQASRPAHGIRLPALTVRVSAGFLTGAEGRVVELEDAVVAYRARPADRSFARARDWQDAHRHDAAVRLIRDRMSYRSPHQFGGHRDTFSLAQRRPVQ
jgi:hypothetical protein